MCILIQLVEFHDLSGYVDRPLIVCSLSIGYNQFLKEERVSRPKMPTLQLTPLFVHALEQFARVQGHSSLDVGQASLTISQRRLDQLPEFADIDIETRRVQVQPAPPAVDRDIQARKRLLDTPQSGTELPSRLTFLHVWPKGTERFLSANAIGTCQH